MVMFLLSDFSVVWNVTMRKPQKIDIICDSTGRSDNLKGIR